MTYSTQGLFKELPFIDLDDQTIAVFSPYAYLVALVNKGALKSNAVHAALEQFSFLGTPSTQGPLAQDHIDITLIVTTDCNLRCKYCFTDAGNRPHQMSEKMALDVLRGLSGVEEKKSVSVTFFGGEPTLAIKTIKDIVDQVRSGKLLSDKKVTFGITTHGVVSVDDAKFLADNGFDIMISADGLPDDQDFQRPTCGNGRTSHIVERTIKTLSRTTQSFKIRSTVTDRTVGKLAEITSYYAGLGAPVLHFEPMTYAGRAGRGDDVSHGLLRRPEQNVYLDNFASALTVASDCGIRLTSSYFMNFLKPSSVYCDAHTANRAVVTPNGELSRCLEIQDACHELAAHGIENAGADRSHLVSVLRDFRSQNSMNDCAKCVAKYACGGGCPVRNLRGTGSITSVDSHECFLHENVFKLALGQICQDSMRPATRLFSGPGIRVHRMAIPANLWMKGMEHVPAENRLSITIPSIFH